MKDKLYVSWEDVEDFVEFVADKYGHHYYSGIYALPRGGLVLGVMLSHKLDIPLLSAPCKGCMIVDDICDSGESLLHYVNNTSSESDIKSSFTIVTMFYKQNKLGVIPDYYMLPKRDKWVVFPWEGKEE